MQKLILLTTGPTNWDDYTKISIEMVEETFTYNDVTVIHGGRMGAESEIDTIADELGFRVVQIPPGPAQLFNMLKTTHDLARMVTADRACLAFWDGVCQDTLALISGATAGGIDVRVVAK